LEEEGPKGLLFPEGEGEGDGEGEEAKREVEEAGVAEPKGLLVDWGRCCG